MALERCGDLVLREGGAGGCVQLAAGPGLQTGWDFLPRR